MSKPYAEIFMRDFALEAESLPFWMMRESRDWNSLWQLREHIIIRARKSAENKGRSYRNFRVGAAAFLSSTQPKLLRSIGRTSNYIYTGANWKTGQDARNTCAEQEIASQIRQQRHMFPARKVLALVIAGEPQDEPDAESGILAPTLHPCRHCRRLLSEIPEIKADTVIITVGHSTDTMEIMSFQELLRLHNRNIRDTLITVAA